MHVRPPPSPQPFIVPAVVVQPVYERVRYVEVPIIHQRVKYVPRITEREIIRYVPRVEVEYRDVYVELPDDEEEPHQPVQPPIPLPLPHSWRTMPVCSSASQHTSPRSPDGVPATPILGPELSQRQDSQELRRGQGQLGEGEMTSTRMGETIVRGATVEAGPIAQYNAGHGELGAEVQRDFAPELAQQGIRVSYSHTRSD
ncbi:unnamed protein product [Vitrella brassicaformis CCMP3155]|uniref:Uncharacterized protein n=2 Tax=Vitrella brassicaformis TaxID=1169539 RepID=A0A0G4G9W3_VITBC|nr:unnamed protein product [Vitrella brassicaformis CCMP3155]|eukprot:CEM25766.1 unnamed protein product [Vitrella brassicaformis CCMP3155]